MQKSHRSLLVLSVVGMLAVVAGVVYSQPDVPGLRPLSKGEKLPPVPELPPVGHLGNIINTHGDNDMQQSPMAHALRSSAAPGARTKHFQSLLNDPGYRLAGWSLEIRDLRQIDGVDLATVRVTPVITTKSGTSATAVGAVDETYELKGQTLKLVKSEATGQTQHIGVIND